MNGIDLVLAVAFIFAPAWSGKRIALVVNAFRDTVNG